MAASTSTTILQQHAFPSKKRSPPGSLIKPSATRLSLSLSSSSSGSIASGSVAPASSAGSPMRDSLRRTPPELVAAEARRQHQARAAQKQQLTQELMPLLEMEYRSDVESYMHQMEDKTSASVDLIDQQPELQWYMRPYLVDFLIEIHQQHRLRPETLYLALNIVDRYVSKRVVFKKHYQLVGCAALWIAAKFEDAKDRVPSVPELCQMCCGAYDESAFIQMEGHVLSTIGWVVGHPTAESWLRLAAVSGATMEEQRTQHVARFVMEITLFHKEYIPHKPSELAKAALLLARFMLGKSRRVQDESEPVLRIAQMLDLHLGEHLESVSAIVVKKYSYGFYSRASTFVREWYLSGRRFSYFDWTRAQPSVAQANNTTPLRNTITSSSSKSSPASVPSSAIVSSPTRRRIMRQSDLSSPSGSEASSAPSSASDDLLDEDDEEDDEREPLTPLTPFGPYSSMGEKAYESVPMEQCDSTMSTSSSSSSLCVPTAARTQVQLSAKEAFAKGRPAVRAPMGEAKWEVNRARS